MLNQGYDNLTELKSPELDRGNEYGHVSDDRRKKDEDVKYDQDVTFVGVRFLILWSCFVHNC